MTLFKKTYKKNWLTVVLMVFGSVLITSCSTSNRIHQSLEKASVISAGEKESNWKTVAWDAIPGWSNENFQSAWMAWVRSCASPPPVFVKLCPQIRMLSVGNAEQKRQWMENNLQPYEIQKEDGTTSGLMTSYYEPEFDASLTKTDEFTAPLYAPPVDLSASKTWYSRSQIDSDNQIQQELKPLAYVASPIDALILQIQGSGKLRIEGAHGDSQSWYRLAFAGTNNQPYVSIGKWLIDRGVRANSWQDIKKWYDEHPQNQAEMLNINPRYVFFSLKPIQDVDFNTGPVGAQGVALTAGRSVAVDTKRIPLGTPLWLSTDGPALRLNKLVIAQDTGGAIIGPVRVDYFYGSGEAAGEAAGKVKQGVRLWAFWPK